MKRLYWDFFGGQAAGTAAHFRRHLDDFLTREAIAGCATGTESNSPLHCAAFCDTPPASEELIIRTLRPRRAGDPGSNQT
jgi:hypothetical protein